MSSLQSCSRAKRREMLVLLLILAGGAVLRFYGLSSESFWFDETYSIWVASHSVGWHLALSTQRIFPLLYYLQLHFWLHLGSSEFVVRMLSVLVGLGSIVVVYALAKSVFERRVAVFSALLLAVSPLHIWFSQEARMYILAATLGLCSAYFMWLALYPRQSDGGTLRFAPQQGRVGYWLAYVLSTAGAIHAHYFAIFLLPFQNIYFLYCLLRPLPAERARPSPASLPTSAEPAEAMASGLPRWPRPTDGGWLFAPRGEQPTAGHQGDAQRGGASRRCAVPPGVMAAIRESEVWKPWLLSQVAVGLLSLVGLAGMFSDESSYWWGLLHGWHGAPTLEDLLGLMFSFSLGTTVQNRALYWGGLLVFGLCALCSVTAFRGQASLSRQNDPARPLTGRRSPRGAKTRPGSIREPASGGTLGRPLAVRKTPRRAGLRFVVQSIDDGLVFTLLYLVVPIATVFVYSQVRSSWVLRYLFLFLPPYCVLLGRGIARLPGRWMGPLLISVIVALSLWPIVNTYRYQQKEDWRGAAQYISAHEQPGDMLLLVDEDIWIPLTHYYHGSMSQMCISRGITDRDFLAARVGLATSSYKRIWLVLGHTDSLLVRDLLMLSPYADLESERHFANNVEVDLFAIACPAEPVAGRSSGGETRVVGSPRPDGG